jgi:hypothetical protein
MGFGGVGNVYVDVEGLVERGWYTAGVQKYFFLVLKQKIFGLCCVSCSATMTFSSSAEN